MSALAAPVRHAAAKATLTLPFRLPTKETITIPELMSFCGMQETFLNEQFEGGKTLSGFVFNGGKGLRNSKRIPRAWAIAFLVKHADWDDESLAEAYVNCAEHFSREQLQRVHAAIGRALQNK